MAVSVVMPALELAQETGKILSWIKKEGDSITIDANAGVINLDVSPAELKRRLAAWKPPAPRYTSGVFAKYCALVSSASEGAVTSKVNVALQQPAVTADV